MQKRQNFWQTHSFVNRGKVWQKPSHRNIEPMEEMFLFKCNFAKEGKRMKMLNEPCLLSISNIWTFSFLLLTLSGALFVTMHHNNHDAYFNFPLTSCETNNSTDNYYCLSYMYLNSAKHVSALRPWSHVLAYWVEGPETYEPCTRGTLPRALLYSEHQFLFFWLGSLDFSPFVMSAKFPLLPPNAEAHRIGPGWIQWRSIGKEFNIIPVGLVHCTAPHPTGFYFWCWVPRVSACISNNASLCQMERTQIVQKRETQYLSSISFSELVGKQEGCREIWFAPTTVTAETSQTIKSS